MERKSGVLLHISSLYSDYSCGNFGQAAFDFIDFLKDAGFTYWQVLPFCSTDDHNSPYMSFCSVGGNMFFVDFLQLYKEGLITDEELQEAGQKTPYLC